MGNVLVALDIETTGLDAARDAVIEIAAVKFRDSEAVDTWSTLVNPLRPLPYKIQVLTGIQPAELQGAPHLSACISEINRFAKGCAIVGHNVGFDLSFLKPHGALVDNAYIDTLELANILVPDASRHSLSALAEFLDIKLQNHHRAMADAMATKDLYVALVERGLRMDLAVLQEINRAASRSQWALKSFFVDLERERARSAFSSTLREQLRAKGTLDDASLGLVLDWRSDSPPLQPSQSRQRIDEEQLVSFLGPDGIIARRFPGYEHRSQQVSMLRSITQAFNEGGQLLAEAGTGTGKSLAYLLPAIYFAVNNGRPVVVSTNTVNLQDQLYKKDIPDLQSILPLSFRAAVLKGRNNYICLRRLGIFRRNRSLAQEVQVLAKILAWLPTTQTGDVTELSLRDQESSIWRQVQAEQESCLGEKCPHRRRGRCFLYRARHLAESAHIIVVNHSLLLSDMLVRNQVLPEYHHLIIDEGHHLEDKATDQLGFTVSRAQAEALLNGLSQPAAAETERGFVASIPSRLQGSLVSSEIRQQLNNVLARLTQHIHDAHGVTVQFFDLVQGFLEEVAGAANKSTDAYDRQIELTSGMRIQPSWSDIEIASDDVDQTLLRVEKGLQALHSGFVELEDQQILQYDDLVQEIWARTERVRELRTHLQEWVINPDEDRICWFRQSARDGDVALHAAPLHVAPVLEQTLFAGLETLVVTSATLSTAGEFDYVRERLGLSDADEIRLDSPFDYQQSTLLFLPTDMPEPAQPNYQHILAQSVAQLCMSTKGRALILFTSHRQLRATYYAIARQLEEAGIVVYGQGLDGSRQQLLDRFRTTPQSVLLGTRSFWEGIDVVGPALSCLVITRLPFSVPTDPIFAARSRTFDDPFGQYAVPEAVLLFRQGFGRLIRSGTDRGVVVILDRRVTTKSYGTTFLESLPGCTICRAPLSNLSSRAVRWLDHGGAEPV